MAKVSPIVRALNGGEFSPLIAGRTDLDKYPSSTRVMNNAVAAPQGPGVCRSGTLFVNSRYDHTKQSYLLPFIFNEDQEFQIEFTDERIRFFTDDGLLTYLPVAGTITSTAPFKIDSATLGANVGDQIAFSGFDPSYNLNGVVGNITNVTGTVYTVDTTFPALTNPVDIFVARVYHIASPYSDTDSALLTQLQDVDLVYLFHPTIKTYKLSRNDTYDWQFDEVIWVDGPYMDPNTTTTSLTPSVRGQAVPIMTDNTHPSGTCSGSGAAAGTDYYMAFDADSANDFWQSDANQTGIIEYHAAAAFAADGYSIYLALDNSDVNYAVQDYGPCTFTFEGSNDGSAWTVLDRQNNYVLYDNNKSVFFPVKNATNYAYYRLNIQNVTRNGSIPPRVRNLVIRSTTSVSMTITASSTTGINNGDGFKATDVGRLIRMQGSDGNWRPLTITAYTDSTHVTAKLLGEPFTDTQAITNWRLGYWSDTTGYPSIGAFYQDRLWAFGSEAYPHLVAGSNSNGQYENMSPTTDDGTVLDTNAIAVLLNSRKLSRPRWAEETLHGLALGTGDKVYVINSVQGATTSLTPTNIEIISGVSRGSYDTVALAIDNNVLFVPRGGRGLRELAYRYDIDGYKAPSMSLLASHLAISPFIKMVYAMEPYSIIWILREDGNLVGLTYNRDEDVVGWHEHTFPLGDIKSISVMPSSDQLQDTLWLVIERVVDGVTQGYIEKLTRFWDFGMDITDAHFVDCALKYSGDPILDVYGLQHLEGLDDVYGLADGVPIGPLDVSGGKVTLNQEASDIIIGIGFDSNIEISRLENGAQDGTAQGKEKRINNVSFILWESYGGLVGVWNDMLAEVVFTPIEYPLTGADQVETISLFTGIAGPTIMNPGYEKQGTVSIKRQKEVPLPLNIVAIMPQMATQDRG